MSESGLATVTELRPDVNFLYARTRQHARAMVIDSGLAETALMAAAGERIHDGGLPLVYDEFAGIRHRAWVDGVYEGLTVLGQQMEERESAG